MAERQNTNLPLTILHPTVHSVSFFISCTDHKVIEDASEIKAIKLALMDASTSQAARAAQLKVFAKKFKKSDATLSAHYASQATEARIKAQKYLENSLNLCSAAQVAASLGKHFHPVEVIGARRHVEAHSKHGHSKRHHHHAAAKHAGTMSRRVRL